MKTNQLARLHDIAVTLHRRPILVDINLTLEADEFITLVGPNGAGKSTLMRVLLGLQAPTAGTLYKKPGLKIGYVPQKVALNHLMPMTVLRFLQLAPQACVTPHEMLAWLHITHLASHQIYTLSGGEWQRVVLARALLRQPELLVLDEPLQGVDVTGQTELYELIVQIKKRLQCTIILVSHDLHLVASMTDRVVCLNKHICCSGPLADVTQAEAFQALFGHHMALYVHQHQLT